MSHNKGHLRIGSQLGKAGGYTNLHFLALLPTPPPGWGEQETATYHDCWPPQNGHFLHSAGFFRPCLHIKWLQLGRVVDSGSEQWGARRGGCGAHGYGGTPSPLLAWFPQTLGYWDKRQYCPTLYLHSAEKSVLQNLLYLLLI